VVYRNGVISRKHPEHTQEFKDSVLEKYTAGMSARAISVETGVHHQTIRGIILREHPEWERLTTRKFVRMTQEQKDRVLELFAGGMLIGHIAKETGHSKTTIERIVGHVPSEKYQKNNDAIIEEIHTAWELGKGLGETARKLNRPKSSIKYYFDIFNGKK